jgi:mannose-1-phosphate guanylyltransferase
MQNNFYVVLLAGGSGTRLWPMSRKSMPKQFHKFSGEKSLLVETYDRFIGVVPKENIYISLGENVLTETQKQLKDIPKENFIVEPVGKNTAPAIGLSAIKIFKKNPAAIIAAISSDHTVKKVTAYQKAFITAKSFVEKNPEYLVVIGIKPDKPETGYGYIKVGKKFSNHPINIVDKFVEKPDLKTAEKYLTSGKYLWNAGYFVFRADSIISMFEKYAPEIYIGLKEILKAIDSPKEKEIINKEYAKFAKVPIDTALAEKVDKIAVVPADLGWSDIGSWASLLDILMDKKNGIVTKGHHISVDDKNCLVYAADKLLTTVGLDNIIIVDTPDVTLVCNKDKSQDVKKLIEKLKEQGKEEYL